VCVQPSGFDVLGSVGVRVSSGDEAAHVGAAVTIDCDVKADVEAVVRVRAEASGPRGGLPLCEECNGGRPCWGEGRRQ
jgi:hypothetical protein